jgi:diaminohydroxyphosphoribosylaminopyrimidine deaminase / 5-amino-6-(5-phosphoribosylamino)uracil reductase
MRENEDNKFMSRCLELAGKAEGMTYPNPLVGSVIVNDGRIIGEGYHLKAGGPHAEVHAINSVLEKDKLKFSTLYVNLEPCSHFGKTPPCADLIIGSKIPRVIIGTLDTSENVSGKGVEKLRKAGCEVVIGVNETACRKINRRFFTFHEKNRPYIILKWAQSADGYLDINRPVNHNTGPNWISGKPERILVHKWRAAEQAILVGAGTIRTDNPKLNVREWQGNDPLKIVISNSGILDKVCAVNQSDKNVVLFTSNMNSEFQNSVKVRLNNGKPAAEQIVEYLHNAGIQSLIIEGGAKILSHFILTGLWDELRIFTGESYFREGVKAPLIPGAQISKTVFKNSVLRVYAKDLS